MKSNVIVFMEREHRKLKGLSDAELSNIITRKGTSYRDQVAARFEEMYRVMDNITTQQEVE